MIDFKPKTRSKLRIECGRAYYTLKRYYEWYCGGKKYAKEKTHAKLLHIAHAHHTPLLRPLKDVDMWLQYNKICNLKIAVRELNGLLLYPGETFSYWRTIGKPTKRKGYLDGMVLYFGGFKPGTGGGLCQLSNLIYWMTIHTPLIVAERHRHSYDVFPDANRTQPFGSGATCVYNYRDLQIFNATDQVYQLYVYLDEQNLYGEWRCAEKGQSRFEIYEKAHEITHAYWGGYIRHNILYRKEYTLDGTLMDDAYLTENHAIMMYQPFLSDGK